MHLASAGQQRQEVLREERCHRDLALVEGPLGAAGAGVERLDGHRGLTLQQPAEDQVADAHQEAHRTQAHLVQAGHILLRGHQVAGQRRRHRLDVGQRLGQQRALGLQPAVAGLAVDELLDLAGHVGQRHTLVADDLAEEEVLRLDGGGALVEGVDLGVADVLLDRVVLQEAGPTEGLQALGELGVGLLGADALDDRQQQVVDLDRQVGVHVVQCLGDGGVLVGRGVEVQRPQTLGVGLLGHQDCGGRPGGA